MKSSTIYILNIEENRSLFDCMCEYMAILFLNRFLLFQTVKD